MSAYKKVFYTLLIFVAGVILGIVSKMLDQTAFNILPKYLQILDLGNFFSRIGIWIFIAVLISIFSKTPLRAAINVLAFFAGMVGSYYLYTVIVAGFYPKSYMMFWIKMTLLSPFLAYICWYAKGKGIIAILISAFIFMFITRQAFAFGFWYISIRYMLEFILWACTVAVLYQSPKQIGKVIGLGLLLFFLSARFNMFWGML